MSAFIAFVPVLLRPDYLYCHKHWWQRTPGGWDQLPNGRYLLGGLTAAGDLFLAASSADDLVARKRWVRDIAADSRLLDIVRQLRPILSVDKLPAP